MTSAAWMSLIHSSEDSRCWYTLCGVVNNEIGSAAGEEGGSALFHFSRYGAVTLQRDLRHFGELDVMLLLK